MAPVESRTTSPPASDERTLGEAFREAFKRTAATVNVITYINDAGEPHGMTATAVCPVSIAPAMLLVCINRTTRSHDEIRSRSSFGVNVLSVGQQEIADQCSRPGEVKRLRLEWLRESGGSGAAGSDAILEDAVAYIGCTVDRVYPAATHSIFIGTVMNVQLGLDREPLIYCDRCYRGVPEEQRSSLEALWERASFGTLS